MDQSSKTLLIIVHVSVTTLFTTGCYGSISNISNWTNAHMLCRKEGKMLPNLLIHRFSNEKYFWTGHYTRLSGWIKIIGCFEETDVNVLTKKSHEMYFPSAGRCQEVCLASNYSVFGLQLNKCVCLEEIPRQRSRGANDCSFSCSGNYTAETNIKFQDDCGGYQTYNLFKSGSEMENSFTTGDCLSVQCNSRDNKFIVHRCDTVISQICNKTIYEVYKDWQSSVKNCNSDHNSYLFGDVNFTDIGQTCKPVQGRPLGPSWIGIAKELYISIDGVIDYLVHSEKNPRRCLKCNSDICTFADCNEPNYFVCLEKQVTTSTTPTGTTKSTTAHGTVLTSSTSPTGTTKITTSHGNVSTSTSPTATEHATGLTGKKKESMKNQDGNITIFTLVIPVTVVVILGSVALLLVILWRRRQTKRTAETRNNHLSEKNDTNHSLQNTCFNLVIKKTDSGINSEKDAKDKGCKSTPNACYDDYDHLGENFNKKEEDDTYHHAFFPSNEDESDYGIRIMSDECQMENPYSHTNTGEYPVALPDNEYGTISINA